MKGLCNFIQNRLLKLIDSFEVELDNLTRFLDTMSTAASSGRNKIARGNTFKKPKINETNFAHVSNNKRAANPTTSIKEGRCTCSGLNRFYHMDLVKKSGICSIDF